MPDKEYVSDPYRWYKSKGYCVRCKLKKAANGLVLCDACRERAANLWLLKRNERLMAGLCAYCGNHPPEKGKMCAVCREKWRERYRRRKEDVRV